MLSADALLPLDQWVFNTEAHPLPIAGSPADAAAAAWYVRWADVAAVHGSDSGSSSSSGNRGGSGRCTTGDANTSSSDGSGGGEIEHQYPAAGQTGSSAEHEAADAAAGQHHAAASESGSAGGGTSHAQPAAAEAVSDLAAATTADAAGATNAADQADAAIEAVAADAAAAGCEQSSRRHGDPLTALMATWQARRAAKAAEANRPAVGRAVGDGLLVSRRPATVNADIAACEAAHEALLAAEAAPAGYDAKQALPDAA